MNEEEESSDLREEITHGDRRRKRKGIFEREDIKRKGVGFRSTSFFFFCLLSEYLRMEMARVDTREERLEKSRGFINLT